MIYKLKNGSLDVEINEVGAELWSIKDKTGREYLWQGDKTYWSGRATNIFPYVGRMTQGKYTYRNQEYQMDIHGFAKNSRFEPEEVSDEMIRFRLDGSGQQKSYPFAFTFRVEYKLEESAIQIQYTVENKDDKTMYFGLGGHPGFFVPFDGVSTFTDCCLEFDEIRNAVSVGLSDDCFVNGKDKPMPLEDGKRLRLSHGLFDHDAIILKDMAQKVTLRSDCSDASITVSYPQMEYLGIWHKPHTEAPYVCIEPWSSLPSRKDVIEDLETQEDLIALPKAETYKNQWEIRLN